MVEQPRGDWCDTALAMRLSGTKRPDGPHLENLVLSDLLVWRDTCVVDRPEVFYWRTTKGDEVDFVVERGNALMAVEVKTGRRARSADARHLVTFRDEYGESVRGCLLLHDDDRLERLGRRVLAAPWWRVL